MKFLLKEFPTVQQKEHLLVERPHSIADNRDSGEQCFDLPNVGRVHLFVEGKLSLESATRLLPFWSFGSRFSLGHSLKQVAEWNSNTPNGIRIRVGGVKGRCPRPLDDGGTHYQYIKDIPLRQPHLSRNGSSPGFPDQFWLYLFASTRLPLMNLWSMLETYV